MSVMRGNYAPALLILASCFGIFLRIMLSTHWRDAACIGDLSERLLSTRQEATASRTAAISARIPLTLHMGDSVSNPQSCHDG
jgi:hypothetical protein